MKKSSFLLLTLYFLASPFAFAQDLKLPRDSEKLVVRAQKFWTSLASGQRLQALEFVLPEKRNLLLSGNPMPVLKARVLGVDLTSDVNQAAVRVSLDVLGLTAAGSTNWTIEDPWIWKGGNWYLNLESSDGLFPKGQPNTMSVEDFRQMVEKNFEILRNPVELGKLTAGDHFSIQIPIKYKGDLPLSIALNFPNPLVDLGVTAPLTSDSENLVLMVGTDNWEGPFNLPLPLKLRYGAVEAEQTLRVTGEVFVPISFRQDPPDGPIEEGRNFSVFIRNNTAQEAGIKFISVDAKLDVVKQPRTVPANAEAEVVLKLRPGQSADQLYLQLETPVNGREVYMYRFKSVRP